MRILAAGPWARDGTIVNPSYSSPHTYAALARATRDRRWRALAEGDLHVTSALTNRATSADRRGAGALVPDWAQVTPTATFAVPAPGTSDPARHGFDAVRAPIRLAEGCTREARRLAAAARPRLRGPFTPAIRELDGRPAADYTHPAALAGAAGAAHAAGDNAARDRLLAAADRKEQRDSTYYGAAWAALGRVLLTTDWLRAC